LPPVIEPLETLTPVLPDALPSPSAVPPTSDPSGWKVLQNGAQGPEVYALQYLLRFHGHSITLDGQFDAQTREAVMAFQSKQGLPPDGVVEGDQTWPALISGAWVEKGDNGDPVYAVQYVLHNKFGYDITVDGDFGPKTDGTVREFQERYNLAVDGQVGPRTWRALISQPAP
jgi:peptidoglycan hydrolase-like protein with peptidoglycan-binding domain